MTKLITLIAIFFTTIVSAQNQFETGMQKGLTLFGEGKNKEAVALFERIASAEKNSWLPNYYISFISTLEAFSTKDKTQLQALLDKAQSALDIELAKNDKNEELHVLQGMIYTAYIIADPMTNGMKYSQIAGESYQKAVTLNPNNPRAVLQKAEFEMGSARFFKKDLKPMCNQIDKAVELFATFKPETVFSPNWGSDRALKIQQECAK